ncbi:MAG: exodeoxyribonuclease VII large subunit [bacterium]
MNNELIEKLKKWRWEIAQNQGVVVYRVLSNKTIEDIAQIKPKNKEELLAIKGIKEKKFGKYGKDILGLVNKEKTTSVLAHNEKENKPYTVSDYLDFLNSNLRKQRARVKGEISSLDIRKGYLFFSIKDKDDSSLLNCMMWENDYELCGISFEEGMEIIVEGFPEVYKLYGKLTFKAVSAELVGEGALKKIYEKLKKKLEDEGLFSLERKKTIPDFVQKIGLITSETGAVIHDFLNNLGKYGYQINFFDSRVEGQVAVKDLISAIEYFKDKDIDVLVIIRGGGSLESLQAFNNEVLVRKITDLDMPVICGIGHDKDVSLASMVADLMLSTPTAVAVSLNKSWDRALDSIRIFEKDIIYKYQEVLADKNHYLEIMVQDLRQKADSIFKKVRDISHQLMNKFTELGYWFNEIDNRLKKSLESIFDNFQKQLSDANNYLDTVKNRLRIANPEQQLRLGYSIVSMGGKVINSVKIIKKGDKFDIKLFDGKIKSKVEEIINK